MMRIFWIRNTGLNPKKYLFQIDKSLKRIFDCTFWREGILQTPEAKKLVPDFTIIVYSIS